MIMDVRKLGRNYRIWAGIIQPLWIYGICPNSVKPTTEAASDTFNKCQMVL